MMRSIPETNWLGKAVTVAVGGLLLIAGFMFSLVLMAIVAVVGATVWVYVLWKTRHLRKTLRAQRPEGQVIEGEVIVVENDQIH